MHSCSSEVLNLKVPSRCTLITIRDSLCSSSHKLERLEQLMVGDSRGQRLDDWLSTRNQVALLPNLQSRDWDCEKVAQEGFVGLDGSSTGKPSEGSPRLSGEVPHQCCRHPDHYQLRLSLGISSVRWESQSLVSLSTPSRKLTRSRLSVPPAIILPLYFKAL